MDKHNQADLYRLVDLLHERFKDKEEYFGIYVWLLYDSRGAAKNIRSDFERHELTMALGELEDYINRQGLSLKTLPSKDIKLNACIADADHSATILPDGSLGNVIIIRMMNFGKYLQ